MEGYNERWRGTTKGGRRRIMMVCGEGCRTIGEMVETPEGTFQTVTTLNQFKKGKYYGHALFYYGHALFYYGHAFSKILCCNSIYSLQCTLRFLIQTIRLLTHI